MYKKHHKKHTKKCGGTNLFYLNSKTKRYKKRKTTGGGIGNIFSTILKSTAKKVLKKAVPLGKKILKEGAKKAIPTLTNIIKNKVSDPDAKQIIQIIGNKAIGQRNFF